MFVKCEDRRHVIAVLNFQLFIFSKLLVNYRAKVMLDTSVLIVIPFLIIGFFLASTYALEPRNIVILVLSQADKYHLKLAEELRQDIISQAQDLKQDAPVIQLSHQEFPHVGGWTVLPLVPRLTSLHQDNATWLVVCQENTRFRLFKILEILGEHDHTKEMWLGHALHDREATIIHHFAFYNDPHRFHYPNIASGFAISMPLLKSLSHRMSSRHDAETEFSIDASHELALFIWNKGDGVTLIHDPAFCNKDQSHCASYTVPFTACDEPVSKDAIFFAVKTCGKFHKDRVPIVKNTWAKYVNRVDFYSDVEDITIPTINLGIPNTEQGHCGKTTAILRYLSSEIRHRPNIKWVVIADDDTILSPGRIQRLLSCFDESDGVALGERYGYRVHGNQGYNYITGGGGMVFSAPLVHRLTAPGACECPSDHSPDDMYLGVCLARLGVPVTHSSLFHQARPSDYAPEYLSSQEVVSFHKHWMIDPVSVYNQWFSETDREMATNTYGANRHSEL